MGVAAILALTAAIPANAADTVDPDSLPTQLVNGDFEYPKVDDWGGTNWTSVDPLKRQHLYPNDVTGWEWKDYSDSFDPAKFGWTSSQKQGDTLEWHEGAVELQHDLDGNVYAELTATEPGTYIQQLVHTTPNSVYTVRLKHASLSNRHLDKMQVLIGPKGHEQPVTMTRETSNGNGDKVGEQSDVIATTVSNDAEIPNNGPDASSRNHAGQWETYVGSYVVPKGQTVTNFTFKNVSSPTDRTGNLVDDITFKIAYPLTYNGNGGTGKVPSDSQAGKLENAN